MAAPDVSRHGMWSSRLLFILAAAGSAVGLGNLWRFPYIAGENGGGAFVIVYLLCVIIVGIPIMMCEVLVGREGRLSPINTIRMLVERGRAHPAWTLIGWMGALAGFLILSFYGVIAGWALSYVWGMGTGTYSGASADFVAENFDDLLTSPWTMLFWQTLFMAGTIFIVARGVVRGLESAIRWFMPALFLLMLVLLGYAITSGGFGEGFWFMFRFDWSALGVDGVLAALGQAFFTLSLGMGAIMAYGAYMPADSSIGGSVLSVGLLDTVIAVMAGLVIFPIVFANGLAPDQGPGLMFVTIPVAFGQLPFGALFGTIFFLLVSFAAITSAISLTEPALAYLVEEYNAKRSRVAITVGVTCWLLGIGTVLSFNAWSDVHFVGQRTFFDMVDYLTQNIMLPVGGLLIAVFVGYVLPRKVVQAQLGFTGNFREQLWYVLVRFVAPLSVVTIFVYTIWQTLA
jgi:neurotransmitter:Na+ symporter, NSS family